MGKVRVMCSVVFTVIPLKACVMNTSGTGALDINANFD